jgi:hypothetical protein
MGGSARLPLRSAAALLSIESFRGIEGNGNGARHSLAHEEIEVEVRPQATGKPEAARPGYRQVRRGTKAGAGLRQQKNDRTTRRIAGSAARAGNLNGKRVRHFQLQLGMELFPVCVSWCCWVPSASIDQICVCPLTWR